MAGWAAAGALVGAAAPAAAGLVGSAGLAAGEAGALPQADASAPSAAPAVVSSPSRRRRRRVTGLAPSLTAMFNSFSLAYRRAPVIERGRMGSEQ